jgi:hypothetical protein
VQAGGVPSQASHLPQASIKEMYRSICDKLGELEKLKEQLDRHLPMPVSRIVTRIAHVKNRVRHLETLCPEVAGNLQMDVPSLISRLTAASLIIPTTQRLGVVVTSRREK